MKNIIIRHSKLVLKNYKKFSEVIPNTIIMVSVWNRIRRCIIYRWMKKMALTRRELQMVTRARRRNVSETVNRKRTIRSIQPNKIIRNLRINLKPRPRYYIFHFQVLTFNNDEKLNIYIFFSLSTISFSAMDLQLFPIFQRLASIMVYYRMIVR